MLGVYDAGRVVNPKLADSQAIGGMDGGIGAALLGHTVTDPRDGRIANANLADYLVPVNADVPDLRAAPSEGAIRRIKRSMRVAQGVWNPARSPISLLAKELPLGPIGQSPAE